MPSPRPSPTGYFDCHQITSSLLLQRESSAPFVIYTRSPVTFPLPSSSPQRGSRALVVIHAVEEWSSCPGSGSASLLSQPCWRIVRAPASHCGEGDGDMKLPCPTLFPPPRGVVRTLLCWQFEMRPQSGRHFRDVTQGSSTGNSRPAKSWSAARVRKPAPYAATRGMTSSVNKSIESRSCCRLWQPLKLTWKASQAGLVPVTQHVLRHLVWTTLAGGAITLRVGVARDAREIHPEAHAGHRRFLASDAVAGRFRELTCFR